VKLSQHIIASEEASKVQIKKAAADAAAPDGAQAPDFLGAILIFVPGLANIQGKPSGCSFKYFLQAAQ
jgi:hypothetical protein